jgi:hypothetical protein
MRPARSRVLLAGVIASLASLAAAPPALAQSAPPMARCDVHMLRAPDAVRLVVEARLRREPRCETSLVVRIVPTTAGLYLLAHTPGGRLYEMVVPEAETAAELIASWALRREPAQSVPPLTPPAIGPPLVEAQAQPAAPAGFSSPAQSDSAYAVPRVAPPGITPERTVEAAPGESAPGAAGPGAKAGQWVSVAGITGDDVVGLRAELDLWSRGGWSGGVAIEYSAMQMMNETASSVFDFSDLRGVLTAGHTLGRGALRLRAQVGLGVVKTEMTGFMTGIGMVSYAGANPIGEAGAHVQLLLGQARAWAFSAGPMLSIYSQTLLVDGGGGELVRTLDVSFVGGLRRRL